MSKIRSDSAWNALLPEQKETVAGWLFEENLGYRQVLERAGKDFGVKASLSSLAAFYKRLARERKLESLGEALTMASGPVEAKMEGERLERAVLKLLRVTAYELALEGPEKFRIKEVQSLVKLLLQSRQQATREGRLAVEQQRHERSSQMAAFKELRAQVKVRDAVNSKRGTDMEGLKAFMDFATTGMIPPAEKDGKKS